VKKVVLFLSEAEGEIVWNAGAGMARQTKKKKEEKDRL